MYLSIGKRIFDVSIAIVGSFFFCWLFLVVCASYILLFQYPIFFFQKRIGRFGKPFMMIKFRTLKPGDQLPLMQRTFGLGTVLRFLSLDEMPQLINVLKGEMSIVGPRPLPVEYGDLMNDRQKTRHLLRPGITGITQVSGRHAISWEKKFEMDIQYVNQVSFWMDLKIILKTLFLLLTPRKDVSLLEEKFKGI
jgi:lipopolysaccharide/colanic/teichoic acid biosynthesis glycosyltransferase